MRKNNNFFATIMITLTGLTLSMPQVNAQDAVDPSAVRAVIDTISIAGQLGAYDLINWQVGDQSDYDVKAFGGMMNGKLHKEAFKEEGAALWVRNQINLMNNNDVSEILINRADGKILKLIHNGKEEQIPNDEIEIINQEYTQITVPAGTFQCIHITAKSKQSSKIEVWANPRDIVLEGTAKQAVAAQFGEVVMELTKFQRGGTQ